LFAHCSGAQIVPGAYLRQPPAPSHFLSVPQEAAPWSMHIFRGSSAPATTLLQWPGADMSAQLLHGPVQASWQQTPSTQNPLTHSPAAPQSLSPLQLPRQAPSAQR
jgi:hypothetical protein